MNGAALAALPVPRLFLWRHGRTEWNATGRFQGQLDPPLDDVGRAQATRAAAYLVASELCPDDTVVASSDLDRAVQTAAALTELLDVPLRLDRRLREHELGAWEGMTRHEVAARHPEQYADWLAGRPVRGRGGEDPSQVAARALAALADLPPAGTAVIVSHGGTTGRLIEALLGLGQGHQRLFGPLGNCAWSELNRRDGHWRLIRHNCTAPQPSESRVGDADGGRSAAEAASPRTAEAASPRGAAPVSGDVRWTAFGPVEPGPTGARPEEVGPVDPLDPVAGLGDADAAC